MKQATQGNTVKVHYTGKLNDGQVFDSSQEREPLEFTIGEGTIIKGFESGVLGMEVGDKKELNIPAEEGYGVRNESLVANVPRTDIPSHIDVAPGQGLQIQQPNGEKVNVVVTDVTEEKVTLDANHPLAGKDLVFDVEMVDIT